MPPLNALGIELMTPGNWEFGFGPAILRERAAELAFPLLAGNVRRVDTGELEFASSSVREIGGVRVAFIGITSPIVTRTMPRPFGAGLRFLDAIDVLPDLVASLRARERARLVVVMSHYGFAQEVAIARAVDGIDVILGGHTHDVLTTPVIVGRTIITQSGAHGSYLSRLDLEMGSAMVAGYRHRLYHVRETDEAAPKVARVVDDALRPHRAMLDEVAGQTGHLLHRGTALESPMDDLITEAYRASTDADVGLSHGWRYATPIPPGPITVGDLWQMIPTNPDLFTVQLSGAALRRMLERSLESAFAGAALGQHGGYVMRFSGMRAVVRLNNPVGSRIQQLEIAGRLVDESREYVVAAAGEQSVPPEHKQVQAGISAIESVRAYLRTGVALPDSPNRRIVCV